MTHDHTCPHCLTAIQVEANPADTLGMADRFLHLVHCQPCFELKTVAARTERAIHAINDQFRTVSDPQQIEKLKGSLKAQYRSKELIADKLERRAGINRPNREQNAVAKSVDGSLTW